MEIQHLHHWWNRLLSHAVLQRLRLPTLAFIKFLKEGGVLQASALTFYALISLVPVLALMLGVARGFGLDNYLEAPSDSIPGESEALRLALELANTLLESVHSQAIAGIGLALLFWSILKVIGHIEEAFNVFWHVRSPRRFWQRVNDYLPLMILAPLAMALSSSIAIYSLSEVDMLSTWLSWPMGSSLFLQAGIFFVSVLTMTALLSWLYHYLPNCTVHWRSATYGGIFASVGYILTQRLYLNFEIGVSNLNAIYGGFIALPLLVSWIYVSWIIILWGAAVAFVHQYQLQHPWELNSTVLSLRTRMILQLALVQIAWRRQSQGLPPQGLLSITTQLQLPVTYLQPLLEELVDVGILYMARDYTSHDIVYALAHNAHNLTLQEIIQTIENHTPVESSLIEAHITPSVAPYHAIFSRYLEDRTDNQTLSELG